jgi:hypothetical protein
MWIAPAVVDLRARTIRFPVRRLGTFQAFVEAPRTALTIFRETFDGGPALPEGWRAGHSWTAGSPPSATAGGPDAPASAPHVLGTNLRGGGYRADADDTVTTPPIRFGRAVQDGRSVVLRFREWVRLGAGTDAATVEVLLPDGSPPVTVSTRPDSTGGGNGFVETGPIPLGTTLGFFDSFRLRFRLRSDGSSQARGWYVDDIDVRLEP